MAENSATATWSEIEKAYAQRVAEVPPTRLTDLITDEQLTALRAGFDYTYGCADILYALASTWKEVQPDIEWIVRAFYTTGSQDAPGGLTASKREIVQVTLAVNHGNALNIGIHVYWALCQDDALTVGEVVNVAMLSSAYLGVDSWSNARSAISTTLTTLAAQAEAGKTDYADVFGALVGALG